MTLRGQIRVLHLICEGSFVYLGKTIAIYVRTTNRAVKDQLLKPSAMLPFYQVQLVIRSEVCVVTK